MIIQIIESADFDEKIQNSIFTLMQNRPNELFKLVLMSMLKTSTDISLIELFDIFKVSLLKYDTETIKDILYYLIGQTKSNVHKDLSSILKSKSYEKME